MNLFKIVDERFFTPLTSKNKRIYVKALLLLHDQFKLEWRIAKSDLSIMLTNELRSEYEFYQFDEEEDQSYSAFSNLIMRKLEETKWIEYEYGEKDFQQYIIIPEYAISFIETIYEVINGKSVEYNTYVYSTYSSLKQAHGDQKDYLNAFLIAHKNTTELLSKLKTLLTNIKRYHKNLSDHSDIASIAREHFHEFKTEISDKIYHPLKTFDSVPRFKGPIIEIINDWIVDDDIINKIVEDGINRKHFEEEMAMEHVVFMMNEIVEIYERVNALLKLIDQKNTAYTKATIERMEYMLNVDGSIKGKLVNILKKLPEYTESTFDLFNVSTVTNLCEASLYKRREQVIRKSKGVEFLPEMNQLDMKSEVEDLRKQIDTSYNNKQIQAYMRSAFGNQNEIDSSDIDIIDDDGYIKLILSMLKHDDRQSFYKVEFEEEQVLKDQYVIPKMKFKKKGK